MKFRTKDLEKYFKEKVDWKKVAQELTLKSFESSYENGILEVDILSNRYADSASLIGISKEISVIKNLKLNLPKFKLKTKSLNYKKFYPNFNVEIKTNLDNYYFGRVILNISNKSSPQWLKEFVEFYGFNSINFLVDLSNFVMIEYGAPLHIFDLDKIKEKIIVRQAKKGEKFISLDGKEYILSGEEIVIADLEKILGLAGIKGSKTAEIDLNTKNIFIESAVFDPVKIYQTSRNLNLKTDASFRFERKVAPIRSFLALERLSYLIQENLGGEVDKKIFGEKELKEKKIFFDFNKVEKLTGLKIKQKEALNILKSLGIKVNKNILTIPLDRLDLENEEDIVEEIIRIYDLNKIQPIFEETKRNVFVEEIIDFNNYLRKILTKAGYNEGWNYSLIGKNEDVLGSNLLEVINPISENYQYFQNTLIYNLIKSIYINQANYKKIKIFEINKSADKNLNEKYKLGIVYADQNEEEILKELKGILSLLEKELQITFEFPEKTQEKFNNLFEIYSEIYSSKNNLGLIGLIKKEVLEKYLVDLNIGVIELNIENLQSLYKKNKIYQSSPVFPPVLRDLSFFVNEKIKFDQIKSYLLKEKINYLKELKLIDIYFTPEEKELKSITIRFKFQDYQRSLTNEEVDQEVEKIKDILKKEFNIILR